MPRARRTATKAVDYSKEQQFSDDDIFEDGLNSHDDDEPTTATVARRKKSSRRSNAAPNFDKESSQDFRNGGGSGSGGNNNNNTYDVVDKYRYYERGYDINQGHIRERFDFMPELELDGSPKVELIVGRRLIGEGEGNEDNAISDGESDDELDDDSSPKGTRKKKGKGKSKADKKKKEKEEPAKSHLEYEYLIKYKGKSYLHLEWKAASELESLNKSAKNLYRRYIKKIQSGNADEGFEDPEFDPAYIQPQRICDEDEHEISVELNDEELIEWEKHQAKEKENDSNSDDSDDEKDKEDKKKEAGSPKDVDEDNKDQDDSQEPPIEDIEIGEPGTLTKEQITRILNKEGPYYPVVKGSDNPYRDGYITEPPKKPRASYLFFQGVYRSVYQKQNQGASVGEVMKLLGDTWGAMSPEEQAPFIELAKEEVVEYEKQRILLEKAQRPNELWQPLRRCLIIIEHLSKDSYSDIFLEPVDTEDFPDYLEYIDHPMDLRTVTQKIKNKKYMGPEHYARDMRKIWSNCKVYNQHGSAIWHVADYMSKRFERLYKEWVLDFRNKYLRWANPKARPWETKNDLSEVELAARKRAELGDIPMKKVIIKKYLVKWAGLGYEHCTWETKEDINDDALIQYFYKENNMTPDEPDLTSNDLVESMKNVKHLTKENAGGYNEIPDFRCQLYSQTRAFQFVKFGVNPPPKLCDECGKNSKDFITSSDEKKSEDTNPAVEMRLKHMPALLVGEYDAVVPMTEQGLLMNVGEVNGSVAFLGYRQFQDGTKGPAELNNIIKSSGDKIIAVDGTSTVGKTFKEVIMLLKGNGKNKCVFIRFLSSKYSSVNGELSSMGRIGRFMSTEAEKQFRRDRRQLLVKRKLDLDGDEDVENNADDEEESDDSADSDSDSEEEASVVSFEQVSDDEDLVKRQHNPKTEEDLSKPTTVREQETRDKLQNVNKGKDGDAKPKEKTKPQAPGEKVSSEIKDITSYQETTQSLALRLLDMNVGDSSDEGGDEDCAYFLDGVDQTFSTAKDVMDIIGKKSANKNSAPEDIPAKKSDFQALSERSKICCAMLLTKDVPIADDFDNYPLPSTKELEALNKANAESKLIADGAASQVPVKLSKTKVEQLSSASNEVIRVWKSAEDAAATLQISLKDIKQVLSGIYSEDLGDEVGGHRWRYAPEDAEVTKIAAVIKDSDKGKKAFLEFRDKLYDHEKPHHYKNGNRLRDYQIDGVNWLASCWYKSNGCILADEMGLGKTVQIVCYIEHLNRVEKIQRPFLVCVPLSTVEHWRREFEGWSNLKVCVYHDRQRVWRDVMREYEWYYADRPHTPDFLKFDVLVTTYDTLIGDFDVIGQIPWRVTVVDEAHRLRNQKGKLLECMKEISAKGTLQHGYQSRVLMTGTPLQNNIQELWTLLNFIEPYKFPSLEEFDAHYGNMGNKDQVERLQNKISPFMLRRVKEDVAKDIPAKEETLIDVELTSIQKQYYRAIFEHNHSFLNMGSSRNVAPKLMNIQMELRKCCNHPFLLDGIEHRETEKQHLEMFESGQFDGKTPEEIQTMLNVKGYIETSGKMVLLDKLLPKLRQEGHKVLIFSQMVKMLDLLAEYCEFRNFRFERLDGRVRGNERQKAIDRFETEDDSFIFMLSTRAGGVGINLTAADICIIFDSDWNPQNDVQAQARCHRIGQTKSVMIYRLITSRSFEQEMFDRASKKLGLEQAVLGTFDKGDDGKPTAKEMEQLLKKGAYALLDEDDDNANDFVADDIENILKKRTRTRVVEGTKTASWLNKQGMVTKSKFTADSKSASLDMDDPNFWEKVMPDFVTPSIMTTKLDELERQTLNLGKKKGRGRGRRKKEAPVVIANENKDDIIDDEKKEDGVNENRDSDTENKDSGAISRTNKTKINKYLQDLKTMMDGVFDDIEDDNFPDEEKATCEKLLLTISCKEKLFSDSQRNMARGMLKLLEGDRVRKCRVAGDEPSRFSKSKRSAREASSSPVINEQLLIKSSKKKKKKRSRMSLEDGNKSSKNNDETVGDDLNDNSDVDGGLSDEEDSNRRKKSKKVGISKKEARRRRAWAPGKDLTSDAGLAWPSFPSEKLHSVLRSLLDKVIKNDQQKGGIFSEPVPKDEFPEYYDMIDEPMDYGTMSKKLDRGDYRSARAMQIDFRLIMSNCLQFNSPNSDIVQEAKRQVLDRPNLLKESAMENHLFISETGDVIEVYSDGEGDANQIEKKIPKKRGRKPKNPQSAEKEKRKNNSEQQEDKPRRGRPPKKKRSNSDDNNEQTSKDTKEEFDRTSSSEAKKKPRLKLNLGSKSENSSGEARIPKKRKKMQSNNAEVEKNLSDGEIDENPHHERKKKRHREDDTASKYLGAGSAHHNIESMRQELKSWKGNFKSALSHYKSLGPWEIPNDIPASKFKEIAKMTITEMGKHDTYSLFESPVTESEAPGYFDVIKKPMDFGTMLKKVDQGDYDSDPKGMYVDFMLIMKNCALYNDDNEDILGEAARLLVMLPLVYSEACANIRNSQ